MFDIILEGDALQIVIKVNSKIPQMSKFSHFMEGIKQGLGSFRSSCVVHVMRDAKLSYKYSCKGGSHSCHRFYLNERNFSQHLMG